MFVNCKRFNCLLKLFDEHRLASILVHITKMQILEESNKKKVVFAVKQTFREAFRRI